MAIDATSTSTENLYINSVAEKAVTGKEAEVSQDEFLQLLVAQMTHQDPLDPMDNAEFMTQLAQLQALDEQISTNETLSAMHLESQIGAASSLLGTLVQGFNANDQLVEGIAARVSIENGEAYIVLDNMQKISLPSITQLDVIMPQAETGSNEAAEIINVDGAYITFTASQGAIPLIEPDIVREYDEDGNVISEKDLNAVSVIDRDSTDYGGGFLTVKNTNGTSMDQFQIRDGDRISLIDNYVIYDGKVIGEVNSEGQGANGDNLTINFTSTAADDEAVAALISSIYFNNTSGNPTADSRNINLVLSDGIIESDPVNITVNMVTDDVAEASEND